MKHTVPLAILLVAAAGSARAAETSCDGLAKLSLPHTEITQATVIAKGAFTAPSERAGGSRNQVFSTLPAFCRVTATLRPSADSDIKIEVWLPMDGWNGRLEAVGNGGVWARISYPALAAALKQGYVSAATNTGHEDSAETNGADFKSHPELAGGRVTFAIGHPEKLVDWGNRAVHEMTVTAKAIIAARYGEPAKYAYWNSCSTGGRQGLVEAEYYPGDFDGLAIGDPPNPMTRLFADIMYTTLAVNKDEASFISRAKWDAYGAAVMKKCDALDGLTDGLISNPLVCKFDPQEMACKSGDADDCLTAAQIVALKKILGGMKNPRTGEVLFPGYPPGDELGPSRVGHAPEQAGVDTFRLLLNKPDWDYHNMDFDQDIARTDAAGKSLMNAADESRLKSLFDRGGKILMYFGWNDGAITPLSAINYYNKAMAANGGKDKTYNSIRLFLIPGMQHCGGGNGPNVFDKVDTVRQWVEQGKAPDQIVAAKIGADGNVERTRPLCPYPQAARYNGSGNVDEAKNFSCAAR